MLKPHELLDRFELLYPTVSNFSDLRRSYIDKDLHSIFRLLDPKVWDNTLSEQYITDLRKFLLEDNIWKMWPLLEIMEPGSFSKAFKSLFVNKIEFDKDCFSRGQLQSKIWLVKTLQNLRKEDEIKSLGTVFICAGWYATLANMLFSTARLDVQKIRSFDIDPSCVEIAEIFNKDWFKQEWTFKALTADIHDIDYEEHEWTFWSNKNNRQSYPIVDKPDTIINTSCEHIIDFDSWFRKIPEGKLVILQSNDFVEVEEHVNCVKDSSHFAEMAPLSKVLFTGELPLEKYTRFMRIGIK